MPKHHLVHVLLCNTKYMKVILLFLTTNINIVKETFINSICKNSFYIEFKNVFAKIMIVIDVKIFKLLVGWSWSTCPFEVKFTNQFRKVLKGLESSIAAKSNLPCCRENLGLSMLWRTLLWQNGITRDYSFWELHKMT